MEAVGVKAKRLRLDFDEILHHFVGDCQLRGLSEKTIIGYKFCIYAFMDFLSWKGLSLEEVDKLCS